MPRNLVRRRRRKIRRIPVQRRQYRSWASPGPAKRRRYLAAAVKLGDALSAVGRTPCLLVWLWRRTLEEAPSGQSTGAQGDTRVCLLGEYEFNRPRPEPESLSAFREGHWGSIISILPFLLENATSLLEKTREVTSPGPWPLIYKYSNIPIGNSYSFCSFEAA